jgi:hypothetical protein
MTNMPAGSRNSTKNSALEFRAEDPDTSFVYYHGAPAAPELAAKGIEMARQRKLNSVQRISRIVVMTTGLYLALGLPVHASDNMRRELAEVAKNLKQLLDGRGDDAIGVGQFTGPAHLPSSSGPAIMKVLSEELQKLGVSVKSRGANLEVRGEYVDVEDEKTRQLAAMLKGRVLDRTGAVITEFERGVFGDAAIASMFGLTAQLPADGGISARDQKLREGVDDPRVHVAGTRISSAPASPYAIEILVKSAGPYQARPVKVENGLAYVPISRGELYAISLVNDSPIDAAVTLTVDGINVFAFSDLKDSRTGQPRYSQWIIPARSRGEIVGWHRTNDATDTFQVMEYAKSAAAELNSTAPIGTITATFSAAWPKGAAPPADEPAQPPSEFSRSGDATGRGPQVATRYIETERNFGVVRSAISVRYVK